MRDLKEELMRKLTLSLICILLAMACVQAQSKAQSKDPESLRGLKGVRLTIWFGRAATMEAKQRSVVLKMLQDDAEAQFTKAGIQLLKFAQEIEKTPGSPHFYVLITLDKPNGYVFPVVIESRLFQKARLSHDPSVELSVSTWESRSIGVYDIKDLDMLRKQVRNDVEEFIKAYLIANPPAK
jgi:hypothetical protein